MELNNPKAKRITWWQKNQIKISPWIFLAPGLIFFSIYVIAPIFVSIGISFYQWDGLSPSIYVGLQNYIELLDDEYFYISLWNNLKWLIFFMLAVPIGLGLAIFLNQIVFGIRLIKSLCFSYHLKNNFSLNQANLPLILNNSLLKSLFSLNGFLP